MEETIKQSLEKESQSIDDIAAQLEKICDLTPIKQILVDYESKITHLEAVEKIKQFADNE